MSKTIDLKPNSLGSLLGLLAVACLALACSSHADAGATCQDFVSEYCQALVTCSTISDASSCESTLAAACPGSGSAKESCSSSQVSACENDIKNESCDALDPSSLALPSSCNGC